MKVFITRKIPQKAIDYMKENNISFSFYKKDQPIPRKELLKKVKNADAVLSLLTDKIDALMMELKDTSNSEKLAELLKKYMQQGQYIVISHNDEVITNASNLYGVSMHDGISKVVSLKV